MAIEIIITGETNKGKILVANAIQESLRQLGATVSYPLEESFQTEKERNDYSDACWVKGHMRTAEIVIKTVKHEPGNGEI